MCFAFSSHHAARMKMAATLSRQGRLARLSLNGAAWSRQRTGCHLSYLAKIHSSVTKEGTNPVIRCQLFCVTKANFGLCPAWNNKPDITKVPGRIQHHDDPPRQDIESKRRRREKLTVGVPQEAHFHVLGQGSPGGPRSLLLYTDCEKFLFNCGEGTQRLCKEFAEARIVFEHR